MLDHRFGFFRVSRVGRVLHWTEGRSYSFSDLSRRGPRAGFPHIYVYEIVPVSSDRCRFRLAVRGLWTACFIPPPLARLWLGGIMLKTRTSIRNALLWDHLRELRRARRRTQGAWLEQVCTQRNAADAALCAPAQSESDGMSGTNQTHQGSTTAC